MCHSVSGFITHHNGLSDSPGMPLGIDIQAVSLLLLPWNWSLIGVLLFETKWFQKDYNIRFNLEPKTSPTYNIPLVDECLIADKWVDQFLVLTAHGTLSVSSLCMVRRLVLYIVCNSYPYVTVMNLPKWEISAFLLLWKLDHLCAAASTIFLVV